MKTNLSAGAVPARFIDGHWEILILRAFRNWDFPKGMVESGEEPWLGALREVEEETGLTVFDYPIGHEFIETEPYGKNKTARYYLFIVKDEKDVVLMPNPTSGIVEHHEFRWCTFNEAEALLVPRLQLVCKWAESKLDQVSSSSRISSLP